MEKTAFACFISDNQCVLHFKLHFVSLTPPFQADFSCKCTKWFYILWDVLYSPVWAVRLHANKLCGGVYGSSMWQQQISEHVVVSTRKQIHFKVRLLVFLPRMFSGFTTFPYLFVSKIVTGDMVLLRSGDTGTQCFHFHSTINSCWWILPFSYNFPGGKAKQYKQNNNNKMTKQKQTKIPHQNQYVWVNLSLIRCIVIG